MTNLSRTRFIGRPRLYTLLLSGVAVLLAVAAFFLWRAVGDQRAVLVDRQRQVDALQRLLVEQQAAGEAQQREVVRLAEEAQRLVDDASSLQEQLESARDDIAELTARAEKAEADLGVSKARARLSDEVITEMFNRVLRDHNAERPPDLSVVAAAIAGRIDRWARNQPPDVPAWLHNMVADWYRRVEMREQAERHLRLAIEGYLAADEPVLAARAKARLASTLCIVGRCEEALALRKRVIEDWPRISGGRRASPPVQPGHIADCLTHLQRYEEVAAIQSTGIADARRRHRRNPERMRIPLSMYGRSLLRAGRYPDAEAVFRELHQMDIDEYGMEDHRLAASAAYLAWALREQERHEEARPFHDLALATAAFLDEIGERRFVDAALGEYLAYVGEFRLAEGFLASRARSSTLQGSAANETLTLLAAIYDAIGRPEDAERARSRIVPQAPFSPDDVNSEQHPSASVAVDSGAESEPSHGQPGQ